MRDIGLGGALAPIDIMATLEPEHILVNEEAWQGFEFEMALNSGSVVRVCSMAGWPGYLLCESPGSRKAQEFFIEDGGTIPNLDQSQLNLSDEMVGRDIQSVFQIAAVTRPLMSVGRICDEYHSITFDAVMAVVAGKNGSEICRSQMTPGGVYVAKLQLRSPAGLGGHE